jgi:ATP-dependent DNA helicase RecG
MELQLVYKLLGQHEGTGLEFKEAENAVPKSLYETVVSFSNTDGGTIILDVADNGKVTGIDADAVSQIKKDIISTLNSRDCVNPPLYLQPMGVTHPDGELIVLQIPASSQIHDHAGRIYYRENDSDLDISGNQNKLSDIYLRKKEFFSENIIYSHLGMDDLDSGMFDLARHTIRSYRSDHPWLSVSDEQLLRDSVLYKKDFRTGEEGLTLAAALIFGKDVTIQNILPAYKVEAMVRRENLDRWDDRITLRTNLISTYLNLKAFINRHLPEKFYMEGDQRVDLRDKIFREVVGNCIVHREYLNHLSTEMIIAEDEVRITNPNKPLFHGIIDPAGFNPYPKNPNIRRFFTAFGWTDEIGSGIRNTHKYLPLYIPGAKPVFEENDTFTCTIPLNFFSFTPIGSKLFDWLELDKSIKAHCLQGMGNIQAPTILRGKDWGDVILHLVPSWHLKGTQLEVLNWPKNQHFKEEAIKNVPSWSEKGTELLRKKAWYYISILTLCTAPIKSSKMMELMGYKNEKSFRDNYLKPLRNLGLIRQTIPDRPTDPENAYVITELGVGFLSGRE